MSVKGKPWAIEKRLGMTMDEFEEILHKEKTITAAAKRIGIDRKTCHKWAAEVGYVRHAGRPPMEVPTFSRKGEWGVVAKWLDAHPGEVLPFDLTKAAELIGASYSAVVSYVNLRKKKGLKYLRSLGDLRGIPIVFTTDSGQVVPSKRITSYELDLNGRTLIVTITMHIGTLGALQTHLPMGMYVSKVKSAMRDLSLTGEVI